MLQVKRDEVYKALKEVNWYEPEGGYFMMANTSKFGNVHMCN